LNLVICHHSICLLGIGRGIISSFFCEQRKQMEVGDEAADEEEEWKKK